MSFFEKNKTKQNKTKQKKKKHLKLLFYYSLYRDGKIVGSSKSKFMNLFFFFLMKHRSIEFYTL